MFGDEYNIVREFPEFFLDYRLIKMFNLINIGEPAGSGVPDVFRTWEEQGWEEPVIEERYGEKELIEEGKITSSGETKNKRYFLP